MCMLCICVLRPLTHWTLGLPFECDEYSNITSQYLSSLIVSELSYNHTTTGIDIVTSIKGFTYIGNILPGTLMNFGLCLLNVSNMDIGEYAVGGTLNDGSFIFANNGKVQVPDICACNITIPPPSPTQSPTGLY